jgi:hypothetical protein
VAASRAVDRCLRRGVCTRRRTQRRKRNRDRNGCGSRGTAAGCRAVQ